LRPGQGGKLLVIDAAVGVEIGGHAAAISRGEERFVLRRPPRGPLPPSAHDALREARLLAALGPSGVHAPEILAACEGRVGHRCAVLRDGLCPRSRPHRSAPSRVLQPRRSSGHRHETRRRARRSLRARCRGRRRGFDRTVAGLPGAAGAVVHWPAGAERDEGFYQGA
jgi:hypothetical protein